MSHAGDSSSGRSAKKSVISNDIAAGTDNIRAQVHVVSRNIAVYIGRGVIRVGVSAHVIIGEVIGEISVFVKSANGVIGRRIRQAEVDIPILVKSIPID